MKHLFLNLSLKLSDIHPVFCINYTIFCNKTQQRIGERFFLKFKIKISLFYPKINCNTIPCTKNGHSAMPKSIIEILSFAEIIITIFANFTLEDLKSVIKIILAFHKLYKSISNNF